MNEKELVLLVTAGAKKKEKNKAVACSSFPCEGGLWDGKQRASMVAFEQKPFLFQKAPRFHLKNS